MFLGFIQSHRPLVGENGSSDWILEYSVLFPWLLEISPLTGAPEPGLPRNRDPGTSEDQTHNNISNHLFNANQAPVEL